MNHDRRIDELEERLNRLEKTFRFHLQTEKKSLGFLEKIVSDFRKLIGP